MSKKVMDKLCRQLIKHAPKEAVKSSPGFWGEAAIPDCLNKQQERAKSDVEKMH